MGFELGLGLGMVRDENDLCSRQDVLAWTVRGRVRVRMA